MRLTRVGLTVVAVLAMCGLSAGIASALPTSLTLDEQSGHVPLSVGEGIRMVTEAPVVIEMAGDRIECQDKSDFSGFFGTVGANNAQTDSMSFSSGGFMFGEGCEGTGTLGGASVEPIGLPWSLSVNVKGRVKLTGAPKVGIALSFSGGATCSYERGTLRGAISPTPIFGSEQRIDFQFASQKLALAKAVSSHECPKTAALTAEFPEVISEANNQYVYEIANTIYP